MTTLPLSPRETARRRLLDALRREGPMARVEIGQHLGMSPASVSDLTASLLDEGILVSRGRRPIRPPGLIRGRPKTRLFFADTLGSVVGVWTGLQPHRAAARRQRRAQPGEPPCGAPLAQSRGRGADGRARRNDRRLRARIPAPRDVKADRPRLPGLCGHARRDRRLEPGARHPRPSPGVRPQPAARQAGADRERCQRHGLRHRAARCRSCAPGAPPA